VTSPYGLRHLVIIRKLSFFFETSSFLVNSALLRLQIHILHGFMSETCSLVPMSDLAILSIFY